MSNLQKNVASQNMTFAMISATTGAADASATVTVSVTKDNGSQAIGGGTVTNKGNGQYNYAPTQAETNATNVGFLFTASGDIPVNYDFHTDVVDSNGYPSANIADILGTASAGAAGYVGVDWANVDNPTHSVSLSSTTISTGQVVASVSGAVGSVTGSVGGSVAGSVGSVTATVSANAVSIGGSSGAATQIGLSGTKIGNGIVGSGSTTTSIVTSALTPSNVAAGQFQGRIVIFDNNTTTAALRGQATAISTDNGSGTLTVAALTTAPVSGDTFTIT